VIKKGTIVKTFVAHLSKHDHNLGKTINQLDADIKKLGDIEIIDINDLFFVSQPNMPDCCVDTFVRRITYNTTPR